MRAHIWDRCFLMHADRYNVDRRRRPYRRLSVTVIVANQQDFVLGVNGQAPQQYQAAIVAPNVRRDLIEAADGVTIFDAGISSDAYLRLAPYVVMGQATALAPALVAQLQGSLRQYRTDEVQCGQARLLFDAMTAIVCQPWRAPFERDPRILKVMQAIEGLPLDQLSHQQLSGVAGLSESRLRALFQRHLDCSISQYMRWATAWKAVELWQRGSSITQVAHAVGFYDQAHANHALNEVFGMSPSVFIDPRKVALFFCGA